MAFNCGDATIEAEGSFGGAAMPVKCDRWSCDICGPRRQKQLIAQGIAGRPTAFITLTSRRREGVTRQQAARDLVAAWQRIVLHFKREQKKPPEARYITTKRKNVLEYRRKVEKIAKREDRVQAEVSAYLCVLEATKGGWPHLHILWRGRYIPQAWLSEQMERHTQSPVCWIEKINNPETRAGYVAKYCGKEPHKFGTLKRYWQTKNYQHPDESSWVQYFPKSWKWTVLSYSISTLRQIWVGKRRHPVDLPNAAMYWGWLSDELPGVRKPP